MIRLLHSAQQVLSSEGRVFVPFVPGRAQCLIQPLPASPRRVFFALYSQDERLPVNSVLIRALVLVLLVAGVEVSAETPLPFGIRVQNVE